jgi:hypothetical protein
MKLAQLLALLAAYRVAPAEFFGGKVEADVFGELERLTDRELIIVRALRSLDSRTRGRLEERFVVMLDSAQAITSPARLHATL